MKVIVVNGPPGCGKSHYIKENYPDELILDMANLRRRTHDFDSKRAWRESMHMLFDEIFEAQQSGIDTVVVEGIFAAGSPSVNWLMDLLDQGISIEFDTPDIPSKEECLRRIKADGGDLQAGREHLLNLYYNRLYNVETI